LHLTVLDVGQGDALILTSPRGRTLAVDAGGSFSPRFDVGEAAVGPYLWSQGVRRLDGVWITHAHPDHAGGVPFLLRSFAPRRVFEGIAPRSDAAYFELDAALRASAAERRTVWRGWSGVWEGVRLRVAGPAPPARAPWRTRNDDSLVIAVEWGEVRLLLTGDVEAAGETGAAEAAQVLKVPHHGSRTSSAEEFVRAVGPRVALVSAGAAGRFGHPHPEVVARYLGTGALLLRTDRDGAVTVSTDGRRLWVKTFRHGDVARIR
jgi:competence protein ComEC